MIIIYLLIALIATIIGGMTGIGGGVIIKPVLDTFSVYDISSINILSSVTIFAMAIVSFIKSMTSGFKYTKKLIIIAIGAIIGGIIGKELLFLVTSSMQHNNIVIMQSSILAFLLVFVLLKSKLKSYYVNNILGIILLGIFLGTTSSFLGIGGGPINVLILHLFLEMDTKQLTIGSIFIILFSQLAKLSSIALSTGFGAFNLEMLIYMVPGGIIGGLIGSYLLKKVHAKNIVKVFNTIIVLIILINIYNIIKVV